MASVPQKERRGTLALMGSDMLNRVWETALLQSEIEEDVRLITFPGSRPQGGAYFQAPGHYVLPGDTFDQAQADAINGLADVHRVVVFVGGTEPILAAKVRHELEHVRQHIKHGDPLFRLNSAVDAAVGLKVGGLMGGGILRGLEPIETDANGAAAMFARAEYPEDAERLVEEGDASASLFRSLTGPGPLETLPERTLAFGFLFAELCEQFATAQGMTFAEGVEMIWPGAGSYWTSLRERSL